MNNNYVDISTNAPRAPKISCPRCRSENVNIQAVANARSTRRKGCAYWVFVGWWLEPMLWFFATIPKLIYEIFRKGKTKTKIVSVAVCQNCGYRWNVVPQKITQSQLVTQDIIQTNPQQRQAIQQGSDIDLPQASSKKKKIWMIIGICAAVFVGSAAISGLIEGFSGKPKKQNEVPDSVQSSQLSSVSDSESLGIIDCDSANYENNPYYKTFVYGKINDKIYKSGCQIPKGRYEIKNIGNYPTQITICVAKNGFEPEYTEKNQFPFILQKGNSSIVEFDGNEYIILARPDHYTLTPLE